MIGTIYQKLANYAVVAVSLVLVLWFLTAHAQDDIGPAKIDGVIDSVTPLSARAGDVLTINAKISDEFSKNMMSDGVVAFADVNVFPARVVPTPGHDGIMVEVVVPQLEDGSSPNIVLRSQANQTAPFTDFEIARPLNLYVIGAIVLAVATVFVATAMQLGKRFSARTVAAPDVVSDARIRAIESDTTSKGFQAGWVDVDSASFSTTAPEPPEDLVEDINQGNCVLVVGGGIAAQAGARLWYETLIEIATSVAEDDPVRESLDFAIRAGKLEQVADTLMRRLPREEIVKRFEDEFSLSRPVPELHKLLAKMPFFAYVDMSWNSAFEGEVRRQVPNLVAVNYRDGSLAQLIRSNQRFIVKLVGDLSQPETVSITHNEMTMSLSDAPEFARGVSSLATSNRLLFLGVSRETIDALMSKLRVTPDTTRPHYAVVPDDNLMQLYQEQYLQKFGVQLLPFNPIRTEQFNEFVAQLASRVSDIRDRSDAQETTATVREAYLDRVILRNIGAFPELELSLSRGWNVVLGNNGCGKSTILKAIGVALCGDAVSDVSGARSLLRRGDDASYSESGSIDIRVGRVPYRTFLDPDGEYVKLTSEQYTPLQTGTWAVLGFPAQRGVVQKELKGTTKSGITNPNVNDVLPLVAGTVDYRMDNLRQWLINTVIRSEDKNGDEAERNVRIRNKFFSIVKDLLVNDEIIYYDIDRTNWKILVKTNDEVVVPIEDLSQGMNSILGWVGTLVQRIYEIHSDTNEPEKRPALVLIDEIDAHLHPAWQMRLIPLLEEHFPRLQVIATTHSPLVAGALDSEHVFIAIRDPETGAATIQKSSLDTEGMAADQILTSPLFGLATSRPRADSIDQYLELLGKEGKRSETEEEEFEELKERVDGLLSFGATPVERQITESVTKAVEEQMEDFSRLSEKDLAAVRLRVAEFFDNSSKPDIDD